MSKPEHIPQDIWNTAGFLEMDITRYAEVRLAIAKGILAERTACAALVLGFPSWVVNPEDVTAETGMLGRPTGREDIADAILKRGETE